MQRQPSLLGYSVSCWNYAGYLSVNLCVTGVMPVLLLLFFSSLGRGAATYRLLQSWDDAKLPLLGTGLLAVLAVYLGDGFLGRVLAERPLGSTFPAILPDAWAKATCGVAAVLLLSAAFLSVNAWMVAPILLTMGLLPGSLCVLAVLKPSHGDVGGRVADESAGERVAEGSPVSSTSSMGSRHANRRERFDNAQFFALFVHGLWLFIYWYGHAGQWGNEMIQSMEEAGVTEENFGSNFKKLQVYLWLSPPAASVLLWTSALVTLTVAQVQRRLSMTPLVRDRFALLTMSMDIAARLSDDDNTSGVGQLSREEQRRIKLLGWMFKLLTCYIMLVCSSLWIVASLVGASLRIASVVLMFIGIFSCILTIYIYISLSSTDKDLLARGVVASPLMKTGIFFVYSDWCKAAMLAPLFLVLGPYLVVSCLNQLVRRYRGFGQEEGGWLTSRTNRQLNRLRQFAWTSVLRKLQLICIGTVTLQVFGGIGTNVTLAWVNSSLSGTDFYTLSFIFVVVGIAMFAIPIVPGIAVYYFGALVIPAGFVREQSSDGDYSGSVFWIGTFIAMVLNFILKMLAIIVEQKGFGEALSTNMWVLQTCGVNKPVMKAIELILRRPGFSFAKVVILCGGPDWPTSVLTGILRLPLCQMLTGSIPVLIQVVTVTLAGAFRLRESDSVLWGALSQVALSVASVWGCLQLVLAAYFVQSTWEEHHEELSVPRREHAVLDWLDHVAEEQQVHVRATAEWSALPVLWRVPTVVGTVVMLVSASTMLFLQRLCWGDFQVRDPIEKLGLHFIYPLGWAALGAFGAASLLYLVFSVWLQAATRERCRLIARELESEKRDDWMRERHREAAERQQNYMIMSQLLHNHGAASMPGSMGMMGAGSMAGSTGMAHAGRMGASSSGWRGGHWSLHGTVERSAVIQALDTSVRTQSPTELTPRREFSPQPPLEASAQAEEPALAEQVRRLCERVRQLEACQVPGCVPSPTAAEDALGILAARVSALEKMAGCPSNNNPADADDGAFAFEGEWCAPVLPTMPSAPAIPEELT